MTTTVVLISLGLVVFVQAAAVTWLINLVVEQGDDIKVLEGRLGKLQRNTGALDATLTKRVEEVENNVYELAHQFGRLQSKFLEWIG